MYPVFSENTEREAVTEERVCVCAREGESKVNHAVYVLIYCAAM